MPRKYLNVRFSENHLRHNIKYICLPQRRHEEEFFLFCLSVLYQLGSQVRVSQLHPSHRKKLPHEELKFQLSKSGRHPLHLQVKLRRYQRTENEFLKIFKYFKSGIVNMPICSLNSSFKIIIRYLFMSK